MGCVGPTFGDGKCCRPVALGLRFGIVGLSGFFFEFAVGDGTRSWSSLSGWRKASSKNWESETLMALEACESEALMGDGEAGADISSYCR